MCIMHSTHTCTRRRPTGCLFVRVCLTFWQHKMHATNRHLPINIHMRSRRRACKNQSNAWHTHTLPPPPTPPVLLPFARTRPKQLCACAAGAIIAACSPRPNRYLCIYLHRLNLALVSEYQMIRKFVTNSRPASRGLPLVSST